MYYKACKNSIVTLEPFPDTLNNEDRKNVMDPSYAKFRCNKAKVISIINPVTKQHMNQDRSIYDSSFIYKVDQTIISNYYDTRSHVVCANGIHYFKTMKAALSWFYRTRWYKMPDGKHILCHDNGCKFLEGSYKDGNFDGK